jgi:hypothetical protein
MYVTGNKDRKGKYSLVRALESKTVQAKVASRLPQKFFGLRMRQNMQQPIPAPFACTRCIEHQRQKPNIYSASAFCSVVAGSASVVSAAAAGAAVGSAVLVSASEDVQRV